MIDRPEDRICFTAVKGPLRLDDLLFQARKAGRLAPVQAVRLDRVGGEDHLVAAARHMWRAMAEGRNQADKPEVEFTRFLAGKRTIKEAIQHMGVPDGADGAVVVALGDERSKALTYFVEMLGLVERDIPPCREATLEAFGISERARTATTPERRQDLILEAVAAVDLARS